VQLQNGAEQATCTIAHQIPNRAHYLSLLGVLLSVNSITGHQVTPAGELIRRQEGAEKLWDME
jgi:hypothetical protein